MLEKANFYYCWLISVSSVGASYHSFTFRCNCSRCIMYRSFLNPNNFWRQLDQRALLQIINTLRNPGIHFLFSGVLMDAHLIDNSYLGGERILDLLTNCIVIKKCSNFSFYLGSLFVASPVSVTLYRTLSWLSLIPMP